MVNGNIQGPSLITMFFFFLFETYLYKHMKTCVVHINVCKCPLQGQLQQALHNGCGVSRRSLPGNVTNTFIWYFPFKPLL